MLNRPAARDQIKKILLERILSGHYQPGERLIELQIANELQTSQAPVREAFRYLEALRVVETETYKGTRVRSITQKELEESSTVRATLEQLAAQLSAPSFKDNVGSLKHQSDLFLKAAADKDVARYSECDIEFHRMIVQQSDNQLLLSIWESVVLESRFRITLKQIGEEQLEEFGKAHLPIIDSLNKGNGQMAGKQLKLLICKFHFLKSSDGDRSA